jgi:hypothetical protein
MTTITGENDTVKELDPRRHLFQYGLAGIIVAVFLAGLIWAFPKVVNRMLAHFDVEEKASQETVTALGSVARAIEGLSQQMNAPRDVVVRPAKRER